MLRKVLLMVCSSALVSAGYIATDNSQAPLVSYSSLPTHTIVKTSSNHINEKSLPTSLEYTKFIQSPPVYESVLTTKENKYESPDGTQHSTFSKSFNSAYSSQNKLQSKSLEDGDVFANTLSGVHSPANYQTHTGYTYSYPLEHAPVYTKSFTVPLSYSRHNLPLTKTIISPSVTSYTTPLVPQSKLVTSGQSSYSSPYIHTVHSPAIAKSVSFPVTYTTHQIPSTQAFSSPTFAPYTNSANSKTKVTSSGLSSYSSHTPVIEAQPIKTVLTYSEAPVVSHMSFSGLGANYAW